MNKRIEITEELVEKINDLLNQGLTQGLGQAEPGQGCVEAMICLALGLPHSDDPICVNEAVRVCKIRINDSTWSSKEARGKALKKIAILQLNTKETISNRQFWLALQHELDTTDDQTRKWSAYAAYAADATADATADAAADDAAYAAYAADDAADDAAYAAYAADAAADDAADAADDDAADDADAILLKFVHCFERALISLSVEGVKWLDLLSE